MARPVVVLPLPDSPTSASVSPRPMVMLTPRTAAKADAGRRAIWSRRLRGLRKTTCRSSTRSSGCVATAIGAPATVMGALGPDGR
jgi:hypothetical protein